MATWEKRRVGRTNLHVTSLGLGTATMGGSRIQLTNEERLKLVNAAWDAGVRYFDTAPWYGRGLSELRLGALLREYPREPFLAAVREATQYGLYDLDRLERMILRRVARDYFLIGEKDGKHD